MPPAFPRLLLVLALLFSGPLMAQGTAPSAGPTGPTGPAVSTNPKERIEIERLLRAGQTVEATQRLDRALGADPRNAELRFLKAVMLAEAGRSNDAAEIYTRLTQEYPELPEPYNNLAVLQAAQGRLDEAREALETALRNDPGYAVAQENLGDIYVRLAARAYERAGSRSPQAQRKLQLARQLVSPPAAAPRS
jgi:Flp pilus assembly protein TadD